MSSYIYRLHCQILVQESLLTWKFFFYQENQSSKYPHIIRRLNKLGNYPKSTFLIRLGKLSSHTENPRLPGQPAWADPAHAVTVRATFQFPTTPTLACMPIWVGSRSSGIPVLRNFAHIPNIECR